MAEVDWHDGKITDAGIDHLRSCIGKKTPVPKWNREVTKDGIEHFALGIGDNNPLWWEDEYARLSPWGRRQHRHPGFRGQAPWHTRAVDPRLDEPFATRRRLAAG